MTVGEKLAEARRYHTPALKQRDLAKLLAVDTSTVGRWESQNHIPRTHLSRICELLDVTESWLLDGSDVPPSSARREVPPEPPNIYPVRTDALPRGQQLIVEGLWVALPVWRGVTAGDEDECAFVQADEPEFREVPAFLTMGQPHKHVLCIASGMSMAPRIEHTERAIVKLDPDVPPGHIVVARTEDNRNFIKKLARGHTHRLELHSLNEQFRPITHLSGWTIKGGVVAILHAYEGGRPNIEWDEGRFLRA
jgi:phage repressor protein C with HTH and peptisase S24 domain